MACHPVTGQNQQLTAVQVHDLAVAAGFDDTPFPGTSESVAMDFTAIAGFKGAPSPAESGGNTDCYNGICCYGLWQINWHAWGSTLQQEGIAQTPSDLSDGATNAKAAKLVYDRAGSYSPWPIAQQEISSNIAEVMKQVGAPDAGPTPGSIGSLFPLWPFGGLNPLGGIEEVYHAVILTFQWLTNPTNWKILGLAVGGGILLLIGVIFLAYIEVKHA